MRNTARLIVAGIAALACAGAVFAAGQDVHVLKVRLPDGSIEQIRYTGDVAPRVVVAPVAAQEIDPFAEMDRMFAAMDAQADAMMAQAAALAARPPAANAPLTRTADEGGSNGGGVYQYSFVSTSTGANGSCSQSYEMTSYSGGQAPKVVSHTQGDCRDGPALTPTVAPQGAAVPKPGVTPTAAVAPQAATPITPAKKVVVTKDAHVI